MSSLDHKRSRVYAHNFHIAVAQEFVDRPSIATTIIQNQAFSRHMISEHIYVQWMSERLFPGHGVPVLILVVDVCYLLNHISATSNRAQVVDCTARNSI